MPPVRETSISNENLGKVLDDLAAWADKGEFELDMGMSSRQVDTKGDIERACEPLISLIKQQNPACTHQEIVHLADIPELQSFLLSHHAY